MPLIVIPDIHGHLVPLDKMIDHLDLEGLIDDHRLVFLGDYFDRGPNSREVIEIIMHLAADGHVALAGNHELVLMKVLDETIDKDEWRLWIKMWLRSYESNTLKSYGVDYPIDMRSDMLDLQKAIDIQIAMPDEHKAFLRSLAWYYESPEVVCVHAGLNSVLSWPVQRDILERREMGPIIEPQQIFSPKLAECREHPAAPKWLVTGHKAVLAPEIDQAKRRVRLNCIDLTQRLVAWISDKDELLFTTY